MVGAQDGIRGDSGWVVVRKACQQSGSQHGKECGERPQPARAEPREPQRDATSMVLDRVRRRTSTFMKTTDQPALIFVWTHVDEFNTRQG